MLEQFPQPAVLESALRSNNYKLEGGVSVTLDYAARVTSLPSDRDPNLNYTGPENEKFEILIPVTRWDPSSNVPLLRDGQMLDYSIQIEIDNGIARVVASSMIDKRSFGENEPVYYQIHQQELNALLETEFISEALAYIQSSSK